MGRRTRNLRRCGMALLIVTGLLIAAPASTSERDFVADTSVLSCASSPDDIDSFRGGNDGSPSLNGLNCPGAPTGCLSSM
jgi:hypothetical protein